MRHSWKRLELKSMHQRITCTTRVGFSNHRSHLYPMNRLQAICRWLGALFLAWGGTPLDATVADLMGQLLAAQAERDRTLIELAKYQKPVLVPIPSPPPTPLSAGVVQGLKNLFVTTPKMTVVAPVSCPACGAPWLEHRCPYVVSMNASERHCDVCQVALPVDTVRTHDGRYRCRQHKGVADA